MSLVFCDGINFNFTFTCYILQIYDKMFGGQTDVISSARES